MGRIEQLAETYGRHIAMPWQQTVSGAQRVIMIVYDKELERTLTARKNEFRIATEKTSFDRELGANLVENGRTVPDKSEFRSQYDPGNPNADKQGYVKLPNVDALVEIMDMREAQRSYEADLTVMDATKQMLAKTVDLLNK